MDKMTMFFHKYHKYSLASFSIRLFLSLLSSVFLIISFPIYDLGWLAWIALVPLLFACHGLRPVEAFLFGLISGVSTIIGTCYWMFEVPGFRVYHAVILGVYMGLYPAVWCFILNLIGQGRKSQIILVPAIWVALDYLKAHAGFMAVSWASLAHSQHLNIPALQLAAYTGEYGITFLIIMSNIAIAETFFSKNWNRVVTVAIIIAVIHGLGFFIVTQNQKSDELQVAVIQPNIGRNERDTAQGMANVLARLEKLSYSVAEFNPALIVWPETAIRDPKKNLKLYQRLHSLAQATNADIITGASEHMKFTKGNKIGESTVQLEKFQYNSAYYISSKENRFYQPYRKKLLVPFGEYLPISSFKHWPSWLVPKSFNVAPGNGEIHFQLPNNIKVSPVICWESLFSNYVRTRVKDNTDLIVHLTNDNWFGTTAAPYQHNLTSVLRAVENRRPVIISSNTGPSQIIDPHGRILAEVSGLFSEGAISSAVPLNQDKTVYTIYGDIFVFLCVFFLVINLFEKFFFDSHRYRRFKLTFNGMKPEINREVTT